MFVLIIGLAKMDLFSPDAVTVNIHGRFHLLLILPLLIWVCLALTTALIPF